MRSNVMRMRGTRRVSGQHVSAKPHPSVIIKRTARRRVCDCRKVVQHFIFTRQPRTRMLWLLKITSNAHIHWYNASTLELTALEINVSSKISPTDVMHSSISFCTRAHAQILNVKVIRLKVYTGILLFHGLLIQGLPT